MPMVVIEPAQDDSNGASDQLKLLYQTNAEQFRYFLTWRQLMLAGYFTVVAALALAWDKNTNTVLSFVPPLAGGVVSLLFFVLELRNKELIKMTSDVGADLEAAMGLAGKGNFGAFQKLSGGEPHHGTTLTIFYLICAVLLWLLAFCSWWPSVA